MNQLYTTLGISKQAVHQYAKRKTIFNQKVTDLMLEADYLSANSSHIDHPIPI